jgi:hypothetical protein
VKLSGCGRSRDNAAARIKVELIRILRINPPRNELIYYTAFSFLNQMSALMLIRNDRPGIG